MKVLASTDATRRTTYTGIYWKTTLKPKTNIDWTEIYELLPKSTILLSDTLDTQIRFAIRSGILNNDNIILKEIEIDKKSMKWKLKIRGREINLATLGICSKFTCTKEKLDEIINIVNVLRLCRGKESVKMDSVNQSRVIVESFSLYGDENSKKTVVRSKVCDQILSFCQSTHFVCKRCQDTISNVTRTTKSNPFNDKTPLQEEKTFKSNPINDTTPLQERNYNTDENNNDVNRNDQIDLSEDAHNDLMAILDKVFPDAPEKMKILLKSQHDALTAKSPQLRRWNKEVISMCLSLWIRTPHSYQNMIDSGMLILPSGRQLRRYKNCIPQESGVNDEIFRWMNEAAKEAKIPKNGYSGGLHHDETKVQKDLVLDMSGGTPNLVGWIDVGEEAFNVKVMKERQVKQELASEVIQLSFVGYTGFRFPICHFPTNGIKASELSIIIWKTIAKLSDWGFQVDYIMQDGGEDNRSFMRFHFEGDPLQSSYGSPNLVFPRQKIYHTQDFSHNIKKLRNSILKSGDIKGFHTRKLMLNGNCITWKHWEDAVAWDMSTNSRRIHYRITEAHLHPNDSEKMRNELAETMLNGDMLHLMKCYSNSLQNSNHLQSTIQLLEQTSVLISIFRSNRLVTSATDNRFDSIRKVFEWFKRWEQDVSQNCDIPKNLKNKSLPSKQCYDDILCMLSTFPKICEQHLSEFPTGSIKPARFNNDVAENVFCQQKGLFNGNDGNPTYSNYSKTVLQVAFRVWSPKGDLP